MLCFAQHLHSSRGRRDVGQIFRLLPVRCCARMLLEAGARIIRAEGARFLLAKRCLSTQVVSFRACYGANINQREEDEQTQNEEHRASSRLEQQQVGAEKASCAFWHNLLRENHYHRRRAEAAKKSTKAEAAVTEAGQTKHKAASCVCFGTLFCEVLTCLPCILFTY